MYRSYPHASPPALPTRHFARRTGLLTAALAVASALTSQAAISFTFNFTDAAGTGFNDPNNAQARAAVLYSGTLLGGYFANVAAITVDVASENNPASSTLASAGSPVFSNGPGFYNNVVQTKVFTGTDQNGAAADASATVNLGRTFQFNPAAPVTASQYDFVSTFVHELTHALGFSSNLGSATPSTNPAAYTIFDKYLTNSAGAPLINQSTFAFNGMLTSTLTGGNTSLQPTPGVNGEFFAGPKAKLAINGQLVPIYSPNPYEDGSSGSHTDDYSALTKGEMMNAATASGPSARNYSAIEMGMMADIGYTLATVPEPSAWALLAAGTGLLGFVTLRRRRTSAA